MRHVGDEVLAQPLERGQGSGHLVEGLRERCKLVPAGGVHAGTVIASRNPLRHPHHPPHGACDAACQHDAEQHTGRDGDDAGQEQRTRELPHKAIVQQVHLDVEVAHQVGEDRVGQPAHQHGRHRYGEGRYEQVDAEQFPEQAASDEVDRR